MSAPASPPLRNVPGSAAPSTPPSPPAPVAFHYTQTDSFVALLNQLGASLLVSTYQANKLLAVRASGPGLSTLVRTFEQADGPGRGWKSAGHRHAKGSLVPAKCPRYRPASRTGWASTTLAFCRARRHVTGDIGIHVTRGLSMPHSPRWHDGKLWVLESGTGGLVLVDRLTGQRQTIAQLPGFTRGLSTIGPYAFIGLSKIRATSAMDGVPLAERRDQLKCGIAVVDLRSGRTVACLEFQTAVEEIFDAQMLPAIRFPEVVGFQKDSLHHTFVIPHAHTGCYAAIAAEGGSRPV